MAYIKSPLNYTGGKYKLLNTIIPNLPSNINTFIDLFGGGFNVGVNVCAKHIIYNDIYPQIVELFQYFDKNTAQSLINQIDGKINHYNLSKENKEGFLKLRENYNLAPTPLELYVLICYAFNNQIRFNKSGEYNISFGKNKSSFNLTLEDNFIQFIDKLHQINCSFTSVDFTEFDFSTLTSNDFVYCDPPYLNSVATYNENKGWNEIHEQKLLGILDELNSRGVKFGLSNNLNYDNPFVDKWKEKYNVHYTTENYNHCSYHKKDKENNRNTEVFITNY